METPPSDRMGPALHWCSRSTRVKGNHVPTWLDNLAPSELPRHALRPFVSKTGVAFSIDKPETKWDEPRCGGCGSSGGGGDRAQASAQTELGSPPRRRGAAPTGEGAATRDRLSRDTRRAAAGPSVVVMLP